MDLRNYLQGIYDKRGQLTPEIVVEEARPDDHALHPYVFDCAPVQAAEAWYRHRAHELIQRVRVVYKQADEDGPERAVRAFHAVRSESGYAYEPVERVVADPFLSKLVLQEMEREYRQLERRFGHMEEFVALARGTVSKTVSKTQKRKAA